MTHDPKHDQPMSGHSYDGIEELDNPLPRWWLYGFYLTIIFAVLYTGYYQFGPGVSLNGAYQQRVAEINKGRAQSTGGGYDSADIVALSKDAAVVTQAKAMFAEKCAACHGDQAQGVIGPNLTDDFWIHGGKPAAIATTITKGVGDKGMPAWGESLKTDDIRHLAAFILTLHGTNPPGAKEPQGEKYVEQ